ncbi:MAG: bifunctional 2-C-methyl-D-erythritol 4-phosphate cytidylyltransferase/2-C-methyl-D-erythritol 2,4-cyclodiphosphate synthase [bacterium]|nr:bifunctional 2-C-methyl-D-erythritol 4-phosphate cytidylyltransferase/2-C-methyl-D-erythritol 2,4-cyclodiphosphate synthase [bacterium]
MPKTIVLIVAAGKGSRAGKSIPKQYVDLAGRMVLSRTIDAFIGHQLIAGIATVIRPRDIDLYRQATDEFGDKLLPSISGGKTRQESVHNGLKALQKYAPERVLIHDAARPFVEELLIGQVMQGLYSHDAVLPIIPVTDTIKQVADHLVSATVKRADLFAAQTPQGFNFPLILKLHEQAQNDGNSAFTDDVSIAEGAGIDVLCVDGGLDNHKLTTSRDMKIAALVLSDQQTFETRMGSGFDVHRFDPGDSVILCGIKIPFGKRLKGHSDADVAMHALTDAIYGTIGAGDIGSHFPPNEAKWQGVASSVFLKHAVGLVRERGGKMVNVDVTIICEQPKISPHREAMRAELSTIMEIDISRIAIKATTTEELGFTGRNEGIAAQAVATIALPTALE